jgi:hypothetical protein
MGLQLVSWLVSDKFAHQLHLLFPRHHTRSAKVFTKGGSYQELTKRGPCVSRRYQTPSVNIRRLDVVRELNQVLWVDVKTIQIFQPSFNDSIGHCSTMYFSAWFYILSYQYNCLVVVRLSAYLQFICWVYLVPRAFRTMTMLTLRTERYSAYISRLRRLEPNNPPGLLSPSTSDNCSKSPSRC